MQCLKCNKNNYCKDGFIKNKQRYLCKSCHYRWTVKRPSNQASNTIKKLALTLYLEGLGFRSIGRILELGNVSILNWIRSFGQNIEQLRN